MLLKDFFRILVFLEDIINGSQNFNIINYDLKIFCLQSCTEFLDFTRILDEIKKVETKDKILRDRN